MESNQNNESSHPPDKCILPTNSRNPQIRPNQSLIFGPNPITTVCPHCKVFIQTRVKYEPTGKTHIAAILLFYCLCWPCIFIPYFLDSCKNGNHYCPNCNELIASYGFE